jgi:tuberculosinol/isotuberculosinol synthase
VQAEQFQNLSTAEVAEQVRAAGPKVCVFPINGTRRWFLLEHSSLPGQDVMATYLSVIEQRHVELYQLIFDHGIETLLTPAFGPDILERGDDYVSMAAEGLAWLATHDAFLDFFDTYGVRVRFYGDHRRHFAATPHAYLSDLFDDLTARTLTHDRYRLYLGLFAHDASETIARLSVEYYLKYGHVPDKRTLVELYYGEYVPPVDFFIGFDRFSVFDMPLVATGDEDLYFTVTPSPYLNEPQLRTILYDHLYSRRGAEPDYSAMEPDEWNLMRDFYHTNMGKTSGVGARTPSGIWYPLPQVDLPDAFPKPAM